MRQAQCGPGSDPRGSVGASGCVCSPDVRGVDCFLIFRKHVSPYYVLMFPDNLQVNPLFRFCYFEILNYNQCIKKRLAMPK